MCFVWLMMSFIQCFLEAHSKITIINNIKIVNYKLILLLEKLFLLLKNKKKKIERKNLYRKTICNLEEKKSISWSIAKCSPVKARSESLPWSSMTSTQQGTIYGSRFLRRSSSTNHSSISYFFLMFLLKVKDQRFLLYKLR